MNARFVSALAVAALVGFAPHAAFASGDVFGDCVGCGGSGPGPYLGANGKGGNGFSDMAVPLVVGSFVGATTSLLYDFPVFFGFPVADFPNGWRAYGAISGVTGVGFGVASIIDGATVHDGVGGIVAGGVSTALGGLALVWSLPQLLAHRPATSVHAALVKDGSHLHIQLPMPSSVRDARNVPAPMLTLFAGTL